MDRSTATDPGQPKFLFVTCQVGAEPTLKAEIARLWPSFHFAYSRPGFLTFKVPANPLLDADFDLGSVFARSCGFSLGKTALSDAGKRAKQVWKIAGEHPYEALHVWQRDTAAPGARGFEPHITPAAHEAAAAIESERPRTTTDPPAPLPPIASPGQLVLDCVLVEPDEWWVGYHRARGGATRWPGGIAEIALPPHAVSRAYLKIEEALAWSELPVRQGQRVVEIGCSPGGASQALLDRGLWVTGIDPALVDPRVLEHPRFTHVQKRGVDVRRREFRDVQWLAADINVAPEYTLDTVEAIVTHASVNIQGLLLTLKLLDWNLAEQIPAYLARIRGWGYAEVKARQLAHNRQEICVVASHGSSRRAAPRQASRQRSTPE